MYFTYIAVFLTASSTVLASSLEEAIHPRGPPGPESSRCYTRVAATRPGHKVSTQWHTSYTPCTVTSTKIVEKTITPASTVTKTLTKTSKKSIAYTVPAPATFTPIQSSLPGSSYGGSGGADPVVKRDFYDDLLINRATSKKPGLVSRPGHPKYPQGVSCYRWTHHDCGTKVVTSTETVTKSRTKLTTVTVKTTVTSTSTTTTVYAACATNNLADSYNGIPFLEVTGGLLGVSDTTADSAYDCCVAAITLNGIGANPDTNIWAYLPSALGSNCFIGQPGINAPGDTCPNPASNPSVAETDPSGNLVIGNSFCGEVTTALAVVHLSSSSSVPVARRTPDVY